jgi:hypothetical protein
MVRPFEMESNDKIDFEYIKQGAIPHSKTLGREANA